jgi:hypothetical protein
MITTISTPNAVATHYTRGNLADAILAGLKVLGKDTTNLSLDDLAPVDESHIRGRAATAELAQQFWSAAVRAASVGRRELDGHLRKHDPEFG